jgi:hypothetical protein
VVQEIHVRHPKIYDPTANHPILVQFSDDAFSLNVESFELPNETLYKYHYRNNERYINAENLPAYAETVRKACGHITYNGWFTGSAAPQVDTAAREFFKTLIQPGASKEAF